MAQTNGIQRGSRYAFLHAVRVLLGRSSQSQFFGPGIYVTVVAGLLIASLVLHNNLRFTERSLIFISLQPLFLPVLIALGLAAIYLAVVASIAVSRERDRRTLEVLLFGPVDEASFLLGSFFAQIVVYLAALLFVLVWSNLVTYVLHMTFSVSLVWMMLTSILMASAVIAFGLLTAVWGGRTRTALVYFFLVVLILVVIQVGDQVVSSIVAANGQSSSDSLLLLRNALVLLTGITQWVSPYSQLTLAMDALASRLAGPYFLHLGVLVLQTVLLLGASILILKRRGGRG